MMNSSSQQSLRLTSVRLRELKSFYSEEKYIWDIGCDHGLLGSSFLDVKGVDEIHFVDPSLPVMKGLKQEIEKLTKDAYITKPNFFFHNMKGQKININNKKNNLIYIAGMGGGEIITILEHLINFLDSSSKIVLSPHRKILELRKYLHELPLSFEREELVLEKGLFYQMFSLSPSTQPHKRISLFGEEIWRSPYGDLYRKEQLHFFSLHQDDLSKKYVNYLK